MFKVSLLWALLLAGCGTTLTAPLPRNTTVATGSLGGPAVMFGGAPVPVPLSTLGVAHAPSDTVTVRGALHPTAAAFGVVGVDVGVLTHPLAAHRAALTLACDAYGFGNTHDAVFLADPWVATRASLLPWLALSGGVHVPIRMLTTSSSLRAVSPFAPTLFVQPAFLIGHWEVGVEFRWYALASCGRCAAPEWLSPGGQGALGVLLGVNYRIAGAP